MSPPQYKHAIYVQTCKLFADLERLRQERETKDMHERSVCWKIFRYCWYEGLSDSLWASQRGETS